MPKALDKAGAISWVSYPRDAIAAQTALLFGGADASPRFNSIGVRFLFIASLLAVSTTAAPAQDVDSRTTDFERQALAYELQECVGGKIQANAQVLSLRSQLSAAIKRADEAGAKQKPAPANPPKPNGSTEKD